MKIASFNANSLRVRMDAVLSWLEAESPDVLCLQETKVADREFPRTAFEERGYHCLFRGQKGYNGVAIVSRTPPEDRRIGFDEQESEGSRIITAVIRGITIVNTYVPQGFHPLSEQFREKLDWLQRLYDYFNGRFHAGDSLIWTGDFNIAPEPEDVYDPDFLSGEVGFHPDERATLRRFRDWGFVDLFRLHNPGPGQYTFWDYQVRNAVRKGKGWRLDHIWATRPLAERSVRAWIDVAPRLQERPSDHTFIAAEFDLS